MGQKILVVEDNELNLKLFCDLLRAHGYETEPVRDGRDAVARARAFVPDLVVMDIQMPYVSGLELIEQMKSDEGLRHTPIMAVTAYAAKGDEERIRDAGAEGYVSKPISVVKFVEAVAGLLAAVARPPEPGAEGPGDANPVAPPLAGEPEPAAGESDREEESEPIDGSPSGPPGDESPPPGEAESEEDAAREVSAESLQRDPPGEAQGTGGKSAVKRRKRGKPATGPNLI